MFTTKTRRHKDTKIFLILSLLGVFVSSCLRGGETMTFKQAVEPRILKFPPDHASHAGFQTEWWYFTGNLKDSVGREFGYQFTIFRRAIDPQDARMRGRSSAWAISDIYIGHLAISDIVAKKFYFEEDAKRGTAGIASATDAAQISGSGGDVRVWIGKWQMTHASSGGWKLSAASGDIAIDLDLSETLAPVANGRPGEEGLSRKGPNPGQASYYYSIPQLTTSGTISVGGKSHTVSGVSWMDHEFGSNQLSADQAGWDWFALQLNDGRALMIYLLRMKDGTMAPASSGTWIEKDGKATYLPLSGIKATPGRTWTSAHSGGQYPVEWQIEIPSQGVSLKVSAAQDDQEVKSSKLSNIDYYEGAVRVGGTVNGANVSGKGYLEITGAKGQQAKGGRGMGGML